MYVSAKTKGNKMKKYDVELIHISNDVVKNVVVDAASKNQAIEEANKKNIGWNAKVARRQDGTVGRGTDQIAKAFNEIGYDEVLVTSLIDKYGISRYVINQQKRFDPYPERGVVRLKNVQNPQLHVVYRDRPVQK